MASYKQSQTTYPYFCQSGPGSNTDISMNAIAISPTFWNNGTNLEKGSDCITTNTANGLLFTAPVSGLYYFEIILNCLNNSSTYSDDSGKWGITITRASPLTNSTRSISDNPENIATDGTEYNTQFSTTVYLNQNDTVKMYSAVFTTPVQRYLANSCFFMGYLVGGFS
jgi:hypothetical protein